MTTKLSTRGQVIIPGSVREAAQLKPGDSLDVGYMGGGMVVLRKRTPFTKGDARALMAEARRLKLPTLTRTDEELVARTIEETSRERSR